MERTRTLGPGLPAYAYLGLFVLAAGEILMLQRVEPVAIFFTPIAWTGYILLADGLVFRLRGESLIMTRRRQFLFMLPWSVLCWLLFEAYNIQLQNWVYVGLVSDPLVRGFGYVWSFATIFPGILETAELVLALGLAGAPGGRRRQAGPRLLQASLVAGALCIVVPLLVPATAARYLFGFVWLGFIFLLEPINYWIGGQSLVANAARGDWRELRALLISGAICGLLWEFWNYWATAKWVYIVPEPLHFGPKIFEMPLFGFVGFLPFAIECYVLQNLLERVVFGARWPAGQTS